MYILESVFTCYTISKFYAIWLTGGGSHPVVAPRGKRFKERVGPYINSFSGRRVDYLEFVWMIDEWLMFEWVLYVLCVFLLVIITRLFMVGMQMSLWSDSLVIYQEACNILFYFILFYNAKNTYYFPYIWLELYFPNSRMELSYVLCRSLPNVVNKYNYCICKISEDNKSKWIQTYHLILYYCWKRVYDKV